MNIEPATATGVRCCGHCDQIRLSIAARDSTPMEMKCQGFIGIPESWRTLIVKMPPRVISMRLPPKPTSGDHHDQFLNLAITLVNAMASIARKTRIKTYF